MCNHSDDFARHHCCQVFFVSYSTLNLANKTFPCLSVCFNVESYLCNYCQFLDTICWKIYMLSGRNVVIMKVFTIFSSLDMTMWWIGMQITFKKLLSSAFPCETQKSCSVKINPGIYYKIKILSPVAHFSAINYIKSHQGLFSLILHIAKGLFTCFAYAWCCLLQNEIRT